MKSEGGEKIPRLSNLTEKKSKSLYLKIRGNSPPALRELNDRWIPGGSSTAAGGPSEDEGLSP